VETRALTDEVAIITGASSGIGAACARLLAGAGMRVVCAGRRHERLLGLAEELGAERALAVRHDVRSPVAASQLVAAAMDAFGRVDALVTNAGVGVYGGILDHPDEALATMIDTNVSGTVWPIRAVLPVMLRDGRGGDIVIVSSVAGLRGEANEAVYAATKSAQIGLAGALNRELGPMGIRVTALCPAGTRTELAIGHGRTFEMPERHTMLDAEDVAGAILTALRQPRRLRTGLWTMWSMSEAR
jgi:NADP-dependent 3-hydroxy acid dehydrogenase YdfG